MMCVEFSIAHSNVHAKTTGLVPPSTFGPVGLLFVTGAGEKAFRENLSSSFIMCLGAFLELWKLQLEFCRAAR